VAVAAALDASATLVTLDQELALTQALRVSGFPSLVLDCDGSRWNIPVDYTDPGAILATIARAC
jgi:protein-disulfide isomerase-like protein with CxxC motif